jgi:hypothetical protein
MEAKNVIAFEFKKEDRAYTFAIPNQAPLGEAYEAAATFLQHTVKLINDHAQKMTENKAKLEKAAEKKAEDPKKES